MAGVIVSKPEFGQRVGCPRAMFAEEEGEEVTQEGIGTRLWSPKGCLVFWNVPQG